MEFSDLIQKRYSVRNYQSKPVVEEKLNKVLEAARLAPTAHNFQPFKLIVIKTGGNEENLKRIYDRKFFVQAPIIICACTLIEDGWIRDDGKNYAEVDTTIAMDHLILAATELGLGTCWIGKFNLEAARQVLNVPDNVLPLVFTPLGYPDDTPRAKQRKSMDDIVLYEKW
ncbi:MAG: nitroreductase family protein [Methanobacterium sp.]|uniref:nitroreductase family protein n=1 Tax=Methanobacterium sp. TaxID=2164 RepID=UPI003C790FA8